MGSVLAFQPRDAATVRKPPLAVGDTASIVIFPGIRYERHEQDAREARQPRGDAAGQAAAEAQFIVSWNR